jgi:hypothetical protein
MTALDLSQYLAVVLASNTVGVIKVVPGVLQDSMKALEVVIGQQQDVESCRNLAEADARKQSLCTLREIGLVVEEKPLAKELPKLSLRRLGGDGRVGHRQASWRNQIIQSTLGTPTRNVEDTTKDTRGGMLLVFN